MHQIIRGFLAVAFAIQLICGLAFADENTHKQAVEELFEVMLMDKMQESSIEAVIQFQIKQNAAFAPYEDTMRAYFSKYMGWPAVKDEATKLFMAEFSEPELREIVTFYRSDAGKKALKSIPKLHRKISLLGQQRVQANMDELKQMITDKAKELGVKP